ncbi:hypothetical protein QFC21_002330 [Naganishia friedmannii]|uniref:Uncharacterized protein n=1 Tax=Naganishia friedmannii TaxID=89922 RepID=A0ACC2VWR9_9TREE|nr:hypothetical protein QFC21_002330 [Naganishia friedmannii]
MYWFKSFIYLEVFFQLPVFAIAAYCLYHNKRSVYRQYHLHITFQQIFTGNLSCPILAYLYSFNDDLRRINLNNPPTMHIPPPQPSNPITSTPPRFLQNHILVAFSG